MSSLEPVVRSFVRAVSFARIGRRASACVDARVGAQSFTHHLEGFVLN
jgi:hypothetical protein